MYSNNTFCQYHPNKLAVTVCERCRRPICLEDKRIYRKRHTRHYGKYSRFYYTTHDYCVLCNASQLRRDASSIRFFLIPLVFGLFIFIFFIGSLGSVSSTGPFVIFLIVTFLIVIFIAVATITARKKADEAEEDAFRFRSLMSNNDSLINNSSFNDSEYNAWKDNSNKSVFNQSESQISSSEVNTISCFRCGGKIDLKDRFCQNCGDSTKEELMDYYKMAYD